MARKFRWNADGLLANVISIGPAVSAMRTHPASVLREE